MTNKALLIITDGIGYNESCNYNAFCNAKKPTYDELFANVPYSLIHTYGRHVGLPDGQMGNSEVGHMTIGCGRILYQDLVKVNLEIENDSLKDNNVLKDIVSKSNNIHLVGLISDGGVHSHQDHIAAIAKIAKNMGKKVFIHLITDGRDVAPDSAKIYIKEVEKVCDDDIKFASLAGRYYTMDRDKRWDRVQRGYDAMAKCTPITSKNVYEAIDESYANGILDEFILPVSFECNEGFQDNDGIIFCNFRSDRAREISNAVANPNFNEFETLNAKLNVATMTEYDKNLPLPVLFEKDSPKNSLAEILEKNGLSQLHTAETEKYAHVTFFFNGGIEEPYSKEKRVLIPSPKVATYDMQPEMSAPQVGDAVLEALDEEIDFVVVNFANGDMVGHTGIYEAGMKAVEAVDFELGRILQKAKEKDYRVVLTSDHGNCEKMQDENGNVLTNHTVGDVFCFVVAPEVKEVKTGGLNNIAPTILKLMNVTIPSEMDESLV